MLKQLGLWFWIRLRWRFGQGGKPSEELRAYYLHRARIRVWKYLNYAMRERRFRCWLMQKLYSRDRFVFHRLLRLPDLVDAERDAGIEPISTSVSGDRRG